MVGTSVGPYARSSPGQGGAPLKEKGGPRRTALRGLLRSLFSWITRGVVQGARVDETCGDTDLEFYVKKFFGKYTPKELICGAEGVLARVEASRQELFAAYGERSQAFINRYIEPVVELVRKFIEAERGGGNYSRVLGAVGSLELLETVLDEGRLRTRVRENLFEQVRQVLCEDISFVMNYPKEVVATLPVRDRKIAQRTLEDRLQPILLHFEKLVSQSPIKPDFGALFSWKTAIDLQRQELHDLAMRTIEEESARFQKRASMTGPKPESGRGPIDILSLTQIEEECLRLLREAQGKKFEVAEDLIASVDSMKESIRIRIEADASFEEGAEAQKLFQYIQDIEALLS